MTPTERQGIRRAARAGVLIGFLEARDGEPVSAKLRRLLIEPMTAKLEAGIRDGQRRVEKAAAELEAAQAALAQDRALSLWASGFPNERYNRALGRSRDRASPVAGLEAA